MLYNYTPVLASVCSEVMISFFQIFQCVSQDVEVSLTCSVMCLLKLKASSRVPTCAAGSGSAVPYSHIPSPVPTSAAREGRRGRRATRVH